VTLGARASALPVAGATTPEGLAGHAHALDVTATVADSGPFDVLVNSVGIARYGPALDSRPEDFDAAFAVNIRGACFLARRSSRAWRLDCRFDRWRRVQ
jgi:NAD(P)-dependent dehydrogenase (short-subunit alcohol dehydrogenase family)